MRPSALFLSLLCGAAIAGEPVTVVHAEASAAPALAVGTSAPDAMVRNLAGEEVSLASALAGKKTILVFFRGGWCPFCTRHLAELGAARERLEAAGWQVVAVAPDTAANLEAARGKHQLDLVLLADETFAASRAFGLTFAVDQATVAKYEGYGIPLLTPDGAAGPALPVPAVFLVDAAGTIRFAHHDPDYRQRLPMAELEAAIAAVEGG